METNQKQYVYIFTRQDMSFEQQAVQSAHVTYKLGCFGRDSGDDVSSNPDETYFTLVGVRNLDALNAVQDILTAFKMKYEIFFEPDLNGGEYTSIAVYPTGEDERGPLLAFNLLKMGK